MSQERKNQGGDCGAWYAILTIVFCILIAEAIRQGGAHYGVTKESCYAALPRAAVCMVMP
jgi:hypothetical protein